MNPFKILLLLLFCSNVINAQSILCSVEDKKAVSAKIEIIQELNEHSPGAILSEVGKTFLGTPYVAKTLEIGEVESLVVNLQGLDCTTFVENAMAFSLLLRREQNGFDNFAKTLEEIRYRDGKLDGYGSRLHYFTEWVSNNEKKGLIKNVTGMIGGNPVSKEINFMSTHRDLYPFLKDDANFEKVQLGEEELKNKPFFVLSQEQLAAKEDLIKTGDIIALATSISGLDVTHTGIAYREVDGRIHLLHASSSGQVEITELPLVDYLKKVNKNIGVTVARPTF